MAREVPEPANFIEEIVAEDLRSGRIDRVRVRFPPEPNGYLHIGHAKALLLNWQIAQKYGGVFHLRMDDTDPDKESEHFVRAIQEDVRWLGVEWGDRFFHASDYFEQLYEWARKLVREGKAYVCSLSPEELARYRGDFHTPGRPSPDRDRPPEESLELLERMRAGEFPDGACTLRARIDMAAPNMNLRDPPMYRIKHRRHFRQGDRWCIYPMYDFAHGQSDAIEGITHSICTLEFEDHRPLYDWFLEALDLPEPRPRQIEFARLNLTYTVLSKRKLSALVEGGHVDGWDDPRMPTIAGLRRRGYTPEAIRAFCERIGVAKRDSVVDVALLEHAVREHLNAVAPRYLGVLRPLRLVITNFPEGEVKWVDAPLHPEDPEAGTRRLPLTRVLWVDRDDFREEAPRKWHRLAPGREVRLRYGCLVTCNEVVRDGAGEVVELRCTWDPDSLGGRSPDGRRVRGTIQWVSAEHAVEVEYRLYDRLFRVPDPDDVPEGGSFLDHLNPDSLVVVRGLAEPAVAGLEPGARIQFERVGYFCRDTKDVDRLVFNRTVPLRDSWARIERREGQRRA